MYLPICNVIASMAQQHPTANNGSRQHTTDNGLKVLGVWLLGARCSFAVYLLARLVWFACLPACFQTVDQSAKFCSHVSYVLAAAKAATFPLNLLSVRRPRRRLVDGLSTFSMCVLSDSL